MRGSTCPALTPGALMANGDNCWESTRGRGPAPAECNAEANHADADEEMQDVIAVLTGTKLAADS
jgi:hypothetical protein